MKNLLFLIKVFCVSLFFFLYSQASVSQEKQYISKSTQANLLELYTSQGCSSCPRSEKWINKFIDHDDLWKKIIPINFHVDYWDYLGWEDPYAFKEFSRRQRLHNHQKNSPNIATPGFLINGRSWSGWFIGHPVPIKRTPKDVGMLQVKLTDGKVDIKFSAKTNYSKNLKIKLVVLGFDQVTDVTRGENHGRELVHHFVAIGYDASELIKDKDQSKVKRENNQYRASLKLPGTKQFISPRKAIVAWVETEDSLKPIQAAAGWL